MKRDLRPIPWGKPIRLLEDKRSEWWTEEKKLMREKIIRFSENVSILKREVGKIESMIFDLRVEYKKLDRRLFFLNHPPKLHVAPKKGKERKTPIRKSIDDMSKEEASALLAKLQAAFSVNYPG